MQEINDNKNLPDKAEKGVGKKPKKSFKAPVILIVVWILIIGLFGYSLWVSKADEDSNIDLTETTIGSQETTTSISSPPVNMSEEQRDQALVRDNLRITDIKTLRGALDSFYNKNEYYPMTLDELAPDYLSELPHNVSPGGQDYVYTGIGADPYSYYEISYALEVGTEGISSGMHVASPDGVALW